MVLVIVHLAATLFVFVVGRLNQRAVGAHPTAAVSSSVWTGSLRRTSQLFLSSNEQCVYRGILSANASLVTSWSCGHGIVSTVRIGAISSICTLTVHACPTQAEVHEIQGNPSKSIKAWNPRQLQGYPTNLKKIPKVRGSSRKCNEIQEMMMMNPRISKEIKEFRKKREVPKRIQSDQRWWWWWPKGTQWKEVKEIQEDPRKSNKILKQHGDVQGNPRKSNQIKEIKKI